jgi:hypothetical protein
VHREPCPTTSNNGFSQGLLGDTAKCFLEAAHYQNPAIAQFGALALLAGVTGRAYNTPTGAGLNLYLMLLASSGSGKDIISRGVSLVTNAVLPTVPSFIDFRGPGEMASAPALIKALANKPCFLSVIGEFGKKFKIMTNPKAPMHEQSLYRALLQLFSKSGAGEVFDPIAYSDKDKSTAAIRSPSLTLIGESVPETFYEALGEGLITDGLLSRFLIGEATGPRPYRNRKADDYQVPPELVQGWAELGAYCLSQMHRGEVKRVEWVPEAQAKFDEYERWTTDEINRVAGEGARQLWNRAYLKALKLASLSAIGANYVSPQIDLADAIWATDYVAAQTNSLIARFANGDVGEVAGNENKQREHVLKVIARYLTNATPDTVEAHFHRAGVITKSHIQQRISSLPAFKNDRLGATKALERQLRSLEEADEIAQLPLSQMQSQFQSRAKAYAVRQPHILKRHIGT